MIVRISRYWELGVGWLKKADRFFGYYFTYYDGYHYTFGFWFFVIAISPFYNQKDED